MIKEWISGAAFAMALCGGAYSYAGVPDGYYETLDGKQGDALEQAVKALSSGHGVVTYSTKTWPAFEKTDVREINGRMAWWDMYSNNLVYTGEHGSLNIEHSVANSWWGGKSGSTEAYSDLFHLNPSDAVANGKKGNNPPGEVADARLFDNGILRVGTPVSGQGGGSASVFEPADEYKGDFARAYFYIFATYGDLNWKAETQYVYGSDHKLAPWAKEMLMRWHREDPVDSKEINRNEEIYKLQNNRNPFIDYPELAEYIWGENSGQAFSLAAVGEAIATDRPEAPAFSSARMTGVNCYVKRWWDGFGQEITGADGTLMVSVDGRDYYPSSGLVEFDPASDGSERHSIKAYVEKTVEGRTLRSAVSSLELIARDPSQTEYSTARWERMTSSMGGELESYKWVVVTTNSLHAMSSTGGTTSVKYLESAGLVDIDDSGILVELPTDAAIVEFQPVSGGKYRMMVSDIRGNYKGSWNATGKNSMKLDATSYTPGKWEGTDANDYFKFRFDQYGALKFNKSQVRFVNYEDSANQTPVYLYRYVDMNGGSTGIDEIRENPWAVGVDGSDIIVPEGAEIYDLNGRRVDGRSLQHGVYIIVGGGNSRKVVL